MALGPENFAQRRKEARIEKKAGAEVRENVSNYHHQSTFYKNMITKLPLRELLIKKMQLSFGILP